MLMKKYDKELDAIDQNIGVLLQNQYDEGFITEALFFVGFAILFNMAGFNEIWSYLSLMVSFLLVVHVPFNKKYLRDDYGLEGGSI